MAFVLEKVENTSQFADLAKFLLIKIFEMSENRRQLVAGPEECVLQYTHSAANESWLGRGTEFFCINLFLLQL